ncbi:MAG: AAA family ATPase [Candidatus Aenigmarchaeota archaeon]|nr:AAA family ATPase [Candidatus Aenigmarchaeota archaeon]
MFYESTIFKKEEVLYPEYLPDVLPHREMQIKWIARNLEPAARGRIPINTFIYGPPGIGKTASIKFVFREFEKFSGLKTIYINCWEFNTSIAVMSEITLNLGIFVQRRGWSKDEVFTRMIEALRKWGKGIIVCLDEVDQLIYKDVNALYDLVRINQYVKIPFGLVFISNYKHVFAKVEPRIKSSLRVDEIEFKPYSFLEMKDILEERAKDAFFGYEKGAIALAANEAIKKGGDVRIGLEILLKAGRLAERHNARKLLTKFVREVIKKVEPVKPKIIEESLGEKERILLDVIRKKFKEGEFTAKEVCKEFNKALEESIGERMVRNYLKHLSEVGMIETIKKGKNVFFRLKVK